MHLFKLIHAVRGVLVAGDRHLGLFEGHRVVVLTSHVELSVTPLHKVSVIVSLDAILHSPVHHGVVSIVATLVPIGFIQEGGKYVVSTDAVIRSLTIS